MVVYESALGLVVLVWWSIGVGVVLVDMVIVLLRLVSAVGISCSMPCGIAQGRHMHSMYHGAH